MNRGGTTKSTWDPAERTKGTLANAFGEKSKTRMRVVQTLKVHMRLSRGLQPGPGNN